MKALIVVDIQNDFLPGGTLAVPEGDAVIPSINERIESGEYAKIVATQDWHPANHKSFAANHPEKSEFETIQLNGLEQVLWPVHCVQGTHGAEFSNDLNADTFDAVFQKGLEPEYDSYSGFQDNGGHNPSGLADYLKARNIQEVDVCGLATDYCVKFTALDAVDCGFSTRLLKFACRGINERTVRAAVEEMSGKGIRVETST